MYNILFVCHGNICRSTAAHYIALNRIENEKLTDTFSVDSCGVSDEEEGNPIYPPMQRVLQANGVKIYDHKAKQITKGLYDWADIVLVMDYYNLSAIKRYFGSSNKVHLLYEFIDGSSLDIDDPWYTRDFQKAFNQIKIGVNNLLDQLIINNK